jgi:hypothetical protein
VSRQRRSDLELIAASQHLLYEIQMMRATAVALTSGLFPPGHVQYALLESFVIHARSLLHFLYPEREQSSDVLAEDYFDDALAWPTVRGELPEVLAKVRARVNKQVAHLTYDRLLIKPEEWPWQFMDIWHAVELKLRIFRTQAPASRVTDEWPIGEFTE